MSRPVAFSFTPAEIATLALGGTLVILVGALGIRAWMQSRISPEQRERRRRAAILACGKMGDATLLEVRGDLLVYSYDVRGVEYTASQDIGALHKYMPPDLSAAVGHIFVKYDPKNPANSIVLAEQWSGLVVKGTL
jgi:hypothetical protein